jgi:dinuclear metal center YbgI/SA1388 family protein
MKCKEIITLIESWAPKQAAWDNDNPGLQAGSLERETDNVFLCLELTDKALREAVKKKCGLIITHHPLIFRPLKRLDTANDRDAKLIEQLIKNDITLYSAHTNLDFTRNGVSFQLAKTLNLKNPDFLEYEQSNQFKLVTFIPKENLPQLQSALFNAGAGIIGNYSNCSFASQGTGSFMGDQSTNPFIGKSGKYETAQEVRIEVLVDKWKLNAAIGALKVSHPYETPAYDVYPVDNQNLNFGYGVLAETEVAMTEREFLEHVKKCLGVSGLRYSSGTGNLIRKVALCGGSGSDLLHQAIASKADAFVTADIKYHTFQDAEGKILFIDAGHYPTEVPVLEEVKNQIKSLLKSKKEKCGVFIYKDSTDPVKFLI